MKHKKTSSLAVFAVMYQYEPAYILWSLPQVAVNTALPLLYVYFPKLLIEKLTDGSPFPQIARTVAIYSLILLALKIFNAFLTRGSSVAADRFALTLKKQIGASAMSLELGALEGAANRELIILAGQATEITACMSLTQNILSGILTVAGLSYIILQLDWVFLLLVALTLALKALLVRVEYRFRERRRRQYASNERAGNYLTGMLYFHQGAAKELRLNALQPWFMGKVRNWREEMLGLQFQDFRGHSLQAVISLLFASVQSLLVLLSLAQKYATGLISLADFTMYFSAVAGLTSTLSQITEHVGEYHRKMLGLADLRALTSAAQAGHSAAKAEGGPSAPGQSGESCAIRFQNVSFSYPGSDRQVLRGVNLSIRRGEKLVLVGANGSGKTTLVKLLCKFYRPTGGKITLDGVDIWDIPNERYYALIAAVFQDYSNFAFTIAENVSMAESSNENMVNDALDKAGMAGLVGRLPNGNATHITRLFDGGGTELSGGYDQKLAIARALYRASSVAVFDEPTASLDPKAESEIYERIFEIAKGITTIFISHRLAASVCADSIAVLADGRVREYGSHQELIGINGLYARMFRAQSRLYTDNDV